MIILPGVYTALLIGAQIVLSGIAGVELVTILLLCFCYRYGAKQGILVATAFSLLRCFVFGFYPNVIVLYLVYYNLFALVIGLLGKRQAGELTIKKHIIVVVVAVLLTISLTLLDDIITPLMLSFTWKQAKVYLLASISTVLPQIVCTLATSILLFRPLTKILK